LNESIAMFEEARAIQDFHKLKPEQVGPALAEPTTLVVPIIDEAKHQYKEGIRFTPEEYEELKSFILGIDEDHIVEHYPENASQLIATKYTNEKSFITEMTIRLCQTHESLKSWLFRQADEHHPLYSSDGTVDRSKLPSDKWDVVELKGAGEVPYLKEDANALPVAFYHWFFTKVNKASPLDRRFMAKEFDMQGNPSRFGVLLKIVQNAVERHWKMVRPADKDLAYYFPLESAQPFEGVIADLSSDAKFNSYGLSQKMGQFIGNVHLFDGPQRFQTRAQCIATMMNLKELKTFAEAGGENQEKNR